ISVYKNTLALKTVLDALGFQTYQNFEIVISEDGRDEAMATFVASYPFSNTHLHLTQADEGWRKNKALNNAIRSSTGDYLIFIDGDCVLHHAFVENHVKLASKMGIVAGKRVKLGPVYSKLMVEHVDRLPEMESRLIREFRRVKADGAKFYEEVFYFPPGSPGRIISGF